METKQIKEMWLYIQSYDAWPPEKPEVRLFAVETLHLTCLEKFSLYDSEVLKVDQEVWRNILIISSSAFEHLVEPVSCNNTWTLCFVVSDPVNNYGFDKIRFV
jgi:hypothetical protein